MFCVLIQEFVLRINFLQELENKNASNKVSVVVDLLGIYYSAPNLNICKVPIIHSIGFHNKTKPMIDKIENSVQNKKSKFWVKNGNNLSKNINAPKGIAAKTIKTNIINLIL